MIDWLGKSLAPWRRRLTILAANRARDARRFALAAALYGEALKREPTRPELRIQRANMLKEGGRLGEAEADYRRAVLDSPDDADAHLQLAHLFKLRGERTSAIAEYRAAASLELPGANAERELALLGERDAQERLFRAALARGATDGLRDLVGEPAWPVADYAAFRAAWDPPAPPDGPDLQAVSLVLEAEGLAPDALDRAAGALAAQSLGAFQAIVVADAADVRTSADRLARGDPRFELAPLGVDVAAATRSAKNDVVVLAARGAILHRHALAWFAWAAAHTPAAAFVCDDERVGPDGRFDAPALRQAVDAEILRQGNPFGDTLALVRSRCADLPGLALDDPAERIRALLVDVTQRTVVGHIPYPLVALPQRASPDARRSDPGPLLAVAASGTAHASATVNVVVPTRDNGEDVRDFVASLRACASQPQRVRVTVVDNGTAEPASLQVLAEVAGGGVDVIRCDEPFNWSRLSNLGARHRDADIVVFANDDMRMLTPGWDGVLDELLGRADVGAVGAKLLYPDQTIQHAGILFGWKGRAIHDGLYEDRFAAGPLGRWRLRRRVAALTGAFLAMRRGLFDEIGGFDEERLAVSYSDLDMSLRVRQRGLAVLIEPAIELTHFESKSRGLTHLSAAAAAVERREIAAFRARWPEELDRDLTVHPAWCPATLPFRLLRAPGRDEAVAWLRASASADPWAPRPPQT